MRSIVATKELPLRLAQEVQLRGIKTVTVQIGTTVKIGGNWHDLNKITLVAVNTATGEVKTEEGWYGNVGMFGTAKETAINQGFEATLLDASSFIVEFDTYPKGATVYAHPDAVSKLLPAPVDLTELQKKALYVIKSYTSPGRYDEARRLGMPRAVFEEVKQGLQTLGLLTKSGALTLAGKQVACNLHY
jgi:hypothetical protein